MNGRFTLEQCTPYLLDILDAPGESTPGRLTRNWEKLLKLASDLRIYYYLASLMMKFWDEYLPEERKNEFKNGLISNAARNIKLTGEIVNLAQQFRLAGIPVLFFKGAAGLARSIYPLALRYVSDIDIIVDKANAQKADRMLKSMNYFNTPSDFYISHHHLAPYYHNKMRGVVEIHFKPYHCYFNDILKHIWDASETITCRNENITVPSMTDHLWILLRKDLLENAYSARLCDLFEIAQIHDKGLMYDYDTILSRATDEKIPNVVYIPWYFLNRFFDINGLNPCLKKNFEDLEKRGIRYQQKSLKDKVHFRLVKWLVCFVRYYPENGFFNKMSVMMKILKCHGFFLSYFQFLIRILGTPSLLRKMDNRLRGATR
jgi:hypothetical protein